ncbi:hypothetical protein F183_A14180 [Bryobacterales bacterium F-183]|nr:hypothetical protein F183_A14180 [Bryobacterales bacterium F-183]
MLELRHIAKRLPSGFSLEIDCQVSSGGITVLFGPSGAGKSLTLDCIAGFVQPDSGRILLNDEILYDSGAGIHKPPQQRHCGYVFQNYALFPHLTLRENLDFAAPGQTTAIQQMLDRFRLTSVAKHRPHELSGGQKQRGSIARALLTSPRLLLLDEPARGLDHELRTDLYEVLRQVRREFATPIILVTHDLDECFELADAMIVMRAGRIVQTGTPEQVLAQPASAEVARLLGCYNVFQAEVAALDPARDYSRLRAGDEYLEGRFVPNCFRGDHLWIGVRTDAVRAVPRNGASRAPGQAAAILEHAVTLPSGTRLEFAGGFRADGVAMHAAEATQIREWLLEFPPDSIVVLR